MEMTDDGDGLDCEHGWIVKNKCITCGMPESQCGGAPTIPLHYVNPELKVTPWVMQGIRDHNFQRLLAQKKLHLVLDLDNTLIHVLDISKINNYHNNRRRLNNQYHMILDGTRLVKLRPGVQTFLDCAKNLFDLSIYTRAGRDYAEEVVKVLDPDGSLFGDKRIISNENCTRKDKKGLDVVISHPQVVLIVDDNVDVWAECDRPNVIQIAPYVFFNNSNFVNEFVDYNDDTYCYEFDGELDRVWGVLSEVHTQFFNTEFVADYKSKDVTRVLESVQMSSSAHDDMDVDISEYCYHDVDVDFYMAKLRLLDQ